MCIWFKSADVKAALPSNFTLDVNEEQAVFVKVIDFPKKLVAQKVPFFCEAKLVVAFGPKEIQRSHEPPPPENMGNPTIGGFGRCFFLCQSGDFQVSAVGVWEHSTMGLGVSAHLSARSMDRSALNKATSADDTPTPGYLYTEILGLKMGKLLEAEDVKHLFFVYIVNLLVFEHLIKNEVFNSI